MICCSERVDDAKQQAAIKLGAKWSDDVIHDVGDFRRGDGSLYN